MLFFAEPLEDQHVGVHRRADGEHDAGDAGQRERRVQCRHDRQHDQQVHHDGKECDDAGQVVVADQEDADDGNADHARHQPVGEIAAAQLRLDVRSLIGSFSSSAGRQPALRVLTR